MLLLNVFQIIQASIINNEQVILVTENFRFGILYKVMNDRRAFKQ